MDRELGQPVQVRGRTRRFVALLSLAIAVLATAATSPSVPETLALTLAVQPDAPALVRSFSGSVSIHADHLKANVSYWLHVPPEVVAADVFSGGQIPGLARVHAVARTDGPVPTEVHVRVAMSLPRS